MAEPEPDRYIDLANRELRVRLSPNGGVSWARPAYWSEPEDIIREVDLSLQREARANG